MQSSYKVKVGSKVVMQGHTAVGELVQIDVNLGVVDFHGLEVKIPLICLELHEPSYKLAGLVVARPKRINTVLDIDAFTSFNNEIDLHGMSVQESLIALEKWLAEALVAGHKRLKVIHGKGTGTLRRFVRKHLSGHEQVRSVLAHYPYLGGEGVTWLELK